MGGSAGQFSTLTSSDFCPVRGGSPLFRLNQGGSPPRSYILLNLCCHCPLGSRLALLPSSHPLPVPQYQHHWIHPSLHLPLIAPNFSPLPHISQSRTSHLTWGSDLLDSWMDAKKIINAQLCHTPYWPGESKMLITTEANATASVWWEEVIAYYCKPPVLDLLVEESRFDGKGFEMIAYIDQHFNPSGAVDSLGHIFNLIDIKQLEQGSVITLKAQFSKVFSALKMGGISINSALQVGIMIRALLHRYQAVVQEFCLCRHSLSEASLQTVVEHCTNYDKDPWKGPVGKDGKLPPRGPPSANAAGTDSKNPYDALSSKSFNYHFGRWNKALKEQKGKCMVSFDSARNKHNTCDCPILKNLGFKIEKRTQSDTPLQGCLPCGN